MEDDIIIRKISLNDKNALAQLYDRVWPEESGRHYDKTAWAVDTSEQSGYCAEAGGRLIGSRACFHANVFIGGTKVTCVQFGNSCVDKDYRRYGLFSRMNKAFMSDFFQTGDELIYNISVDASRKAYEKIGWVYIKSLSNIIYIVHPLSFLFKVKGNIHSLAGNMFVDDSPIPDVDIIPTQMIDLRESIMIKMGLIHNRYDKETLKWRMGTNSGIKLLFKENIGAVFYKTGSKNGLRCCIIGEMFLEKYSKSFFNKMFKAIKEMDNFDIISISITHSHPLYHYFRQKGFLLNPKKPFLNHGIRVESDKMKKICLNPCNWAIADLDIDTF